MAKIRIIAERCQHCGRCVEICPEGLLLQPKKDRPPRIPRQRGCIGCGHCVSICPHGAVEHIDFPVEGEGSRPGGL